MKSHREKLAKFLRTSRLDRALTQVEVARALGHSTPQFVSNWERGIVLPPIKSLRTLSRLCKLNRLKLFKLMMAIEREDLRSALFGRNLLKNETYPEQ